MSDKPPLFGLSEYEIRQKILSVTRRVYEIKDKAGNLLGYCKKERISMGPKFWFENLDGEEVGRITGKMFSALRRTYTIYDVAGNERGKIKRKLLKIFGSKYWLHDAEGNKLATVKGNIVRHNYKIISPDKKNLAEVGKAWISLTDSYGLTIETDEIDPLLMLSFIIIMDDQEHD